jgi:hypothetical protein
MAIVISSIVFAGSAVVLAQAGTAADVYAPLFDVRYHGTRPSIWVVTDMTVPMPTLSSSSADWLRQFDDVPVALRQAASQPSPTRARILDVAQFPTGTKLVSERAIQTIFTGGVEDGWAAFRREYGSDGWLAFSEVLFTVDALDALVYYEARCGGLCGEGGYAWLHRDAAQSGWSIRKKIVRWMS